MIPSKTSEKTITGNVTGRETKMRIAAGAEAFIVGILTDMYSDRIMACVREYGTNARDAQIQAGVDRPIEITLPTSFAPDFVVRDYGIGLNADDIERIYSQYGESTKRESNEYNGMLGIGCKAGLTYSDQFVVESVKDGSFVQVLVSRDSAGAATMTVVFEGESEDPNGTTIRIPTKNDRAGFAERCRQFYKFWEPGTVLVDGEEPYRIVSDALKVTDGIYVTEGESTSYVVMGGVAYPWSAKHGLAHSYNLVVFADTGAVDFAPSREALMDTPHTQKALHEIAERFKREVPSAIMREIDAAETLHEAVKLRVKWRNVYTQPIAQWTYKGQVMPDMLQGEEYDTGDVDYKGNPIMERPQFTILAGSSYVLSRHGKQTVWSIDRWPDTLFVTDYDRPTFTANQRKKIDQWKLREQVSVGHILLIPFDVDLSWIDPDRIVSWKIIEAEKLPVKARSVNGKSIPGSYPCFTENGHRSEVAGDDIRQGEPLFYLRDGSANKYAEVLRQFYKHFTIVTLTENRVDKFRRLFPMAKPVVDGLTPHHTAWAKKLTYEQREAMTLQQSQWTVQELKRLDILKVNDPDIKRAIRLARMDLTTIRTTSNMFQSVLGSSFERVEYKHPLDRYPLFDSSVLRSHSEHVYCYLNAAYAARI